MLISFVVPIYNTEAWLAECINSILALQGEYAIEIVMVDDASTDNSEQIARSFDDPRIRYVRHATNKGAAFTIDECLRLATGDYVARIDSDDRYLPWFLQRTVPLLEAHPDVGMVYGDIRMIDPAGAVTCPHLVAAHDGKAWMGDELDDLLKRNAIPAPTVLARKQAWLDALPIPAAYSFNDWYLSLEIAKRWKMCYVPEPLADYRIHQQNMHRSMISNRKGEEITLDILAKYFGMPMRPHHDERFRKQVYAIQYVSLADKYFGCGLYSDARRCYVRATAADPALLLQPAIVRRLLGTCLGKDGYESAKHLFKRIVGKAG
ncbi:MAG: glycosyltransferase [Pseudomonadota bacterium]